MTSATNTTAPISSDDLRKLLKLFSSTHYKSKATDKRTEEIEDNCIALISKDYKNQIIITNENGELSNSYPSKIVIPENDDYSANISRSNTLTSEGNLKINRKTNGNHDVASNNGTRKLDAIKLKDLMCKARVARCRARFPIPVILYKNKYICRSATLSSGAEIYGRSVYDYYAFNDYKNYCSENVDYIKTYDDDDDDYIEALEESPPIPRSIADTSQLFSKVRNQDIKLLKYFSVNHICDLMLEKKKVKFGMNVTSSEKADKENRYSDFDIISLPYPGCEFFREYRDNSYSGEGLVYNWNQNFVDAKLDLPNCDEMSKLLRVNFKEYRSWDVIKLTQTYIKLLLHFIREYDSSILIHCISGWDRTPLFMSLLRLTLWADGEIHKSLSPIEITYLTVAYDWFLFGHNLNDRLNKGEEIMFFCFQFLKFITDKEYDINFKLPKRNSIREDDSKRKVSIDSFSNGDDFVIENMPTNYRGSSLSLNSNCSIVSAAEVPICFSGFKEAKNDDLFTSSFSPSEINKLTISNNECASLYSSVPYSVNDNSSLSSQDEMVSTLTSSDKLHSNSNSFLKQQSPSHYENSVNNNFHSSTKPVEIPNSRNFTTALSDNSLNSLSRSDSWQFVSDAGSIRDNHLSNQFSSPDSLTSLRKDNTGNSNSPLNYINKSSQDGTSPKLSRRKEKLSEVRSIFNSAYTSLSFDYHQNKSFF